MLQSLCLMVGFMNPSTPPVATTNAKPDDPSKAQLFQNFIILHTFPCSIPIFLTEVILTINTDFPTSPLFSLSLESKWKLGYGLSVVTCFYKGVSQGILTCLMVAVTATTSQNLNSTGCQIQVIHETYKLASQKGKWQLLTIWNVIGDGRNDQKIICVINNVVLNYYWYALVRNPT